MVAMPGMGGVNPLEIKNKLKSMSSSNKAPVSLLDLLLLLYASYAQKSVISNECLQSILCNMEFVCNNNLISIVSV